MGENGKLALIVAKTFRGKGTDSNRTKFGATKFGDWVKPTGQSGGPNEAEDLVEDQKELEAQEAKQKNKVETAIVVPNTDKSQSNWMNEEAPQKFWPSVHRPSSVSASPSLSSRNGKNRSASSSATGNSNLVNNDNGKELILSKIAEMMAPSKNAKTGGTNAQAVSKTGHAEVPEVSIAKQKKEDEMPKRREEGRYEKVKKFGNGAKEVARSAGHNVKEAASRAGNFLGNAFSQKGQQNDQAGSGRNGVEQRTESRNDQNNGQRNDQANGQRNDQAGSGRNGVEQRTESRNDQNNGQRNDREGSNHIRPNTLPRNGQMRNDEEELSERMGYEGRSQSEETDRRIENEQNDQEESLGRNWEKRHRTSSEINGRFNSADNDQSTNGWKRRRDGTLKKAKKFRWNLAKLGRSASRKASHLYHNAKDSDRTASLRHRTADKAHRMGSKVGHLSRSVSRKVSSVLHKNDRLKNGAHSAWNKAKHAYSRANSFRHKKGRHHSSQNEIPRHRPSSVSNRRHLSSVGTHNKRRRIDTNNANKKMKARHEGGINSNKKIVKKRQPKRKVHVFMGNKSNGGRNKRIKKVNGANNARTSKRSRPPHSPTPRRQPHHHNARIIYASSDDFPEDFSVYRGAYVDDVAFNFR